WMGAAIYPCFRVFQNKTVVCLYPFYPYFSGLYFKLFYNNLNYFQHLKKIFRQTIQNYFFYFENFKLLQKMKVLSKHANNKGK
ncbi:hypothetical protein ACJX0J_041014, partial [Zea mays]